MTNYETQELLRLKKIMQSPAYWKDHNQELYQEVQHGFERLYDNPPNKARNDLPEAKKGQMANMLGLNGDKNAEDSIIGHLTPGEIVVPLDFQTPELMALLKSVMGDKLPTYTVGSGKEHINPESGLPAFFFKLKLNKSKSASVYAPPFIWGPWMPLFPLHGFREKAKTFTLSYNTISPAPSSFDIEISYAGNTVRRVGPGAYRSSVPANSINELKVRAKSHSLGQILLVTISD